jgi:uncharacterized protein (TIGR02246 family)
MSCAGRRRGIGAIVLIALFAPLLFDLLLESDAEAIEALLDRAVVGLEDRDVAAALQTLSDDFQGTVNGRKLADLDQLQQRLEALFDSVVELRIELDETQVEVDRDEASVDCRGVALFRGKGGGFPANFEIRAALRRDPERGWLLIGLEKASVRPGLR